MMCVMCVMYVMYDVCDSFSSQLLAGSIGRGFYSMILSTANLAIKLFNYCIICFVTDQKKGLWQNLIFVSNLHFLRCNAVGSLSCAMFR